MSIGVFTYPTVNAFTNDTMFESFTGYFAKAQEYIKNVVTKPDNKRFMRIVSNPEPTPLYMNCDLTDLQSTVCGYSASFSKESVEKLKGIAQLTVSIPYRYFYPIFKNEKMNPKPDYETTNDHLTIDAFELDMVGCGDGYTINDPIYSFLYVMYYYCLREISYDPLIQDKYFKGTVRFKPRSNLAVSYLYLCLENPELSNQLVKFYENLSEITLKSSELRNVFEKTTDEEMFYYCKLKVVFTVSNNQDALSDLARYANKNSLDADSYLYLVRKYLLMTDDTMRDKVANELTKAMSKDDKIEVEKKMFSSDNNHKDLMISLSVMYLIRQLIDPRYARYVTRVDEFDRSKIDPDQKILNGYLYNIPPNQLERLIKEGYIKRCTTHIPYCHINDPPELRVANKLLQTTFRLEMFEWIPTNSSLTLEFRNVHYNDACKSYDCIQKIIKGVLTDIQSEMKKVIKSNKK